MITDIKISTDNVSVKPINGNPNLFEVTFKHIGVEIILGEILESIGYNIKHNIEKEHDFPDDILKLTPAELIRLVVGKAVFKETVAPNIDSGAPVTLQVVCSNKEKGENKNDRT